MKNAFVLTDLIGSPECPVKSHLNIRQPLILCSSCFKSSSWWRIVWNIVYFASKLYPPLCKNGREQKKKERAQIGALLVRTVREAGFNTSSNANQLVFRTISQPTPLPDFNICSPETQLQLVLHTAAQLVVICFPIPHALRIEKAFCFFRKQYRYSHYYRSRKIQGLTTPALLLSSFYIILPT